MIQLELELQLEVRAQVPLLQGLNLKSSFTSIEILILLPIKLFYLFTLIMEPLLKLRLKLAATGFALAGVAIGTYFNCVYSLRPDPFLDAAPSKTVVSKAS